jgi:hypothetical protein
MPVMHLSMSDAGGQFTAADEQLKTKTNQRAQMHRTPLWPDLRWSHKHGDTVPSVTFISHNIEQEIRGWRQGSLGTGGIGNKKGDDGRQWSIPVPLLLQPALLPAQTQSSTSPRTL